MPSRSIDRIPSSAMSRLASASRMLAFPCARIFGSARTLNRYASISSSPNGRSGRADNQNAYPGSTFELENP